MTASETAFTPLSITLFGPMQVLIQGEPLPHLRSRKALWLMALLTLRHSRPVEREWLAGTLWPDIAQHLAFANLRPVISELRRALQNQSELLQSPNRHTLRLELIEANVDVLAFDAAITSGTPAALERAVALYRGPLLEGCTEEWVWQERSQREQHCLQALQKLAGIAITRKDYGAAADYYRRAIGIAPVWDAAQRGLMETFAKSGDRNAALQVYRDFVNLLKNDPKAVPDESTTALYLQLRNEARQQVTSLSIATITTREEPSLPVRVGYLPQPLTDLIGREDERLEVITRLRKSRLLTLTGPGGIGKTRLAMEVATELTREYSEGVWFVGLESLISSERIIPHIANLLGLREEPGRSLLDSLTTYLNRKRLLLVLDNCEHLVEACAQIASHLLRECAGIRILTTSREPLRITGEVAWTVPALAVPDPKHLPQGQTTLYRVLQGYESIQLFIERAQAVQSSFAMTKNNALAVAQICARLEGIPLAIELAAARIKAMTVEQIVTQLDDYLGLLTTGNRIALVRQQTLRGTLDWSSALLSESERILLRRLSVFIGGWSLAAAEQIGVGDGMEARDIPSRLESLVEKSLVVFEEKESTGRYRLLEMVRQYAIERLQVSGETERTKNRHRDWCLTLAEGTTLQGAEPEIGLRQLETEHDNLRAALAWCAKDPEGAEIGLLLAGTLWRFWYVRGHFSEGRQYLMRALEHKGAQASTEARARALHGAGNLAKCQSDHIEARSLHEESLNISRQLGDRRGIAFSLNSVGNVVEEQGDHAYARALHEESLSIFKELGDQRCIAWALNCLGNVVDSMGEQVAAQAMLKESLSIRREIGDKHSIAFSLNNLGNAIEAQGNFAAAQLLYEESLNIFKELEDQQGIGWSLLCLGSVMNKQGEYEVAKTLYQESLSIFRTLGNEIKVLENLGGLAQILVRQGEAKKAICLWGAIHTVRQRIGTLLLPQEQEKYDHQIRQARSDVGEDTFTTAWERGRTLTIEQAIAYAQQNAESSL